MRLVANAALAVLIVGLLAVASTVTVIPVLTHTKPVNIIAGSMTGSFMPFGTLVYIDPSKQPAVGDVITFRLNPEASPISHRVVAIEPDPSGNDIQYITKGDANATNDAQPALRRQVAGTVTSYIPYAGLATGLLDKFPVQVFLASIALGLYWLSGKQPSRVSGRVGEMGT